jgi:hypothetical protein
LEVLEVVTATMGVQEAMEVVGLLVEQSLIKQVGMGAQEEQEILIMVAEVVVAPGMPKMVALGQLPRVVMEVMLLVEMVGMVQPTTMQGESAK